MYNIKSNKVRPKKSLGQHFLNDQNIAKKIVHALASEDGKFSVLEIGPGTGILTRFLMEQQNTELKVVEIDRDSVAYLKKNFPLLKDKIIEGDFLKLDLNQVFQGNFAV